MQTRIKTQRGLSFTSVMLGTALAAFFGTLFFMMAPSYFKFWQVRSAMEGVQQKPELLDQGPRVIIKTLLDQLYIDDVRTVTADDFSVVKSAEVNGLDITVDYEEQAHVFLNVDVLMHFNYTVTVTKP